MSRLDDIHSQLKRKRKGKKKRFEEKMINKYLKALENENVLGLDVVVSSLGDIHDSGVYEELKNAYKSSDQFFWERGITKEMPEDSIYSLAHKNLGFVFVKPRHDIRFAFFMFMYTFIELRYYMTIRKIFDYADYQNVYLSGLDERLIFGLDKFDEVSDWPRPTAEFFKKLKKVKWDKETRNFSRKLKILKISMTVTELGFKYEHLIAIEEAFIELIAGCSAVNDNRDWISKEDIVVGYKTYLKLLKTDVTKYKARSNFKIESKNDDNGYLVCDKCNEYYKLQPRESPEDFTDKCECGGKLKYYDNIDWLFDEASSGSQDGRTYS